ncbi:MAG: hypothetical protein AAFY71_09760 [Bacteroidota bacterium]
MEQTAHSSQNQSTWLKVLQWRYFPLVLVGMAMLSQAEHRWNYPQIYLDNQCQMAVFTHWENGEGWVAYDNDYGRIGSMHRFPPLYGMQLGLLQKLTGSWLSASRIIDILNIWSVLVALALIFRDVNDFKESWPFWLFMVFSFAPFHDGTGSDLMALNYLSLAVWCGLRHEESQRTIYLIMAVVILGLSIWVRPAYLSVGSLFVVYYSWKWILDGEKSVARYWALSTLVYLLFAGGMLYWQNLGPNLLPKESGLYLKHLFLGTAFVWDAWVFIPSLLSAQMETTLSILSWSFSILILYGLLLRYLPIRDQRKRLGILLLGLNVSFLYFLSLTQAPEDWNEAGMWTYVMEKRYFLPSILVILVGSCSLLGQKRIYKLMYAAILLWAVALFGYVHFYPNSQTSFEDSKLAAIEKAATWVNQNGNTSLPFYEEEHQYVLEASKLRQSREVPQEGFYLIQPIEMDLPKKSKFLVQLNKGYYLAQMDFSN